MLIEVGIGIFIPLFIAASIGLAGMIAALVGGGVGYALGHPASAGWGCFGTVLGGLAALSATRHLDE